MWGLVVLVKLKVFLNKCLQLSSPKYSIKQSDKDEDSGKRKIVKSYSLLIDDFKDLVHYKNDLQKNFRENQEKFQDEIYELSRRKTEELKRLKSIIKSLKQKLDN